MGVQAYSSWPASTQSQEDHHGPHHHILPQWELPCQRPNWPGQYWYPFAEGTAVHLSRVSEDLQRHQRHGVLSAAHLGRDRGTRRDLARPWVSRAHSSLPPSPKYCRKARFTISILLTPSTSAARVIASM